MKRLINKLAGSFKLLWTRLGKIVRILYKRARARINADRSSRSRFAYLGLSFGTVVVAFLLVLLNMGVFSIAERTLYDKERYENVEILSAEGIADPLSRAMRVEIYRTCTVEGEKRATLPDERSRDDAIEQVYALWEQTLRLYADEKGTLKTGESVDRVLRGSKYTAHLSDFYNEETGAKIAIWGAQAYYNASGGRVYCLSAELDSRTTDVYSITVSLYENITENPSLDDFTPMLTALKESTSVANTAIVTQTGSGTETVLTLSDGSKLYRTTQTGLQTYLTLG